jgi:hypothetical protein
VSTEYTITLTEEELTRLVDILGDAAQEIPHGDLGESWFENLRTKIWSAAVEQAQVPSEEKEGTLARIAREYEITPERLKELVEDERDEDGFPLSMKSHQEYWAVQDADTEMLGDCGCFDSHADDCPNALPLNWREPNYSPLDQ